MATAADKRVPYESGGAGEKPFRPEINEDAQTASQEAGRNNPKGVSDEGGNSTSISAATGILELEQSCKQKIFITRSEIQHPMTMESLPRDVLLNIFIRLLAKQLAQMRCVSKSWNALLSQSSFIKSHLHRSINNNDQILMVFYAETSSSDPKSFTAYPSQSTHLELANFIKLPPVNSNSGGIIRVIGSVHGLICFSNGNDVIHIWNPSLSALLTLPPHYIPSSGSFKIFFRFGFDPKTEDYKVVKMIGLTGTLLDKECLQVEVYSMKKGSWESVSQKISPHFIMLVNCDVICVDGHDGQLHWVAHFGEKLEQQTILAFDLSSETFREMPFPDSILDGKCLNRLGVSGGKLCVLSFCEDEGDRYEVWVMEEYGVVESWLKRYAFSCFASDVDAAGFTSHNELLLIDHNNNLGFYDPVAHKAKFLEKLGLGNYNALKVVEYVDSFVWVAPAEHRMVDGGRQN